MLARERRVRAGKRGGKREAGSGGEGEVNPRSLDQLLHTVKYCLPIYAHTESTSSRWAPCAATMRAPVAVVMAWAADTIICSKLRGKQSSFAISTKAKFCSRGS